MELCHGKLFVPFSRCSSWNQVCMLSLIETICNTDLPQKLLLCIEDLTGFTIEDSSATSTSETAN